MKCKQVQKILSEYLDGIVSEKKKRQIQQHLEICRDCSEQLRLLEKTVNLLRQVPEVCVPANFVSGVMEKIQEKQVRRSRINLWLACIVFAEVIVLLVIISSKQPYQKEIAEKIEQKPAQQKEEKVETIEKKSSKERLRVDLTEVKREGKTEIVIQIASYKVSGVGTSGEDAIEKEQMLEEKKPVAGDKPHLVSPMSAPAKSMGSMRESIAQDITPDMAGEKISIESEIKRQISSVNGKIISEQKSSETEIIHVITAEIPGSLYKDLIKNFEKNFQIRNLPLLKEIDASDSQIKIKIEVFR